MGSILCKPHMFRIECLRALQLPVLGLSAQDRLRRLRRKPLVYVPLQVRLQEFNEMVGIFAWVHEKILTVLTLEVEKQQGLNKVQLLVQ